MSLNLIRRAKMARKDQNDENYYKIYAHLQLTSIKELSFSHKF